MFLLSVCVCGGGGAKLTFQLGVTLRTKVQLFFFFVNRKTKTISCKLSLSGSSRLEPTSSFSKVSEQVFGFLAQFFFTFDKVFFKLAGWDDG